jgi:predicted nucleic acid-binding protein
MRAAVQAKQLPYHPDDLLVAAIATIHGCVVATRDVRPLVNSGVPVFNPWTGERFNGA